MQINLSICICVCTHTQTYSTAVALDGSIDNFSNIIGLK